MSSGTGEEEGMECEEDEEDDDEEEDNEGMPELEYDAKEKRERYVLPERSTRGTRIHVVMEDEEKKLDEDFWQQEFFQEETADQDYKTETEEEDVADSDFSKPESSDEEEEGDVNVRDEEPRKRKILPPGSQALSGRKATNRKAAIGTHKKKKAKSFDIDLPVHSPPVLRKSTIERRAEAAQERLRQEQLKVKRKKAPDADKYRPLTQAELLREAAQTELKNLASLKELVAREEACKKKAMATKARYNGPLVRMRSRKDGEFEKTTLEICNMQHLPTWCLPREAPEPAERSVCVVTGLPAKYRDPVTGLPYATIEAFKIIRKKRGYR